MMINKAKKSMKTRCNELRALIRDPESPFSWENLLDNMKAFIYDLDISALYKDDNVAEFLMKYKKVISVIQKLQRKPSDFKRLKKIAEGYFGEVFLVKHIKKQKWYCMKTLNKFAVAGSTDLSWGEREIMASATSSWLVQLEYALQDRQNLYLIMDFAPTGSLSDVIGKYKCLPEDWVRFYAAELALAVDALHSMGYIHCNIKAESVLLDSSGHLRLSDFNMARKMDLNGFAYLESWMGAPHNVPPEAIDRGEFTGMYGRELDWWSFGALIYKLVVGTYPPCSFSMEKMMQMIKNREKPEFPAELEISKEAQDFICSFLTDKESRLGFHGVEKIKQHRFLKCNQWDLDTIQKTVAPVVLKLSNTNYCVLQYVYWSRQHELHLKGAMEPQETFVGMQITFAGFTYFRNYYQKKQKDLEHKLRQELSSYEALNVQLNHIKHSIKSINPLIELELKLEMERAAVMRLEKQLMELDHQKQKLLSDYQLFQQEFEKLNYNSTESKETQSISYIYFKGHEFVPSICNIPRICKYCRLIVWSHLCHSLVLKCKRCHVRCHKYHVDRMEERVSTCKKIYVAKEYVNWKKKRRFKFPLRL